MLSFISLVICGISGERSYASQIIKLAQTFK